MKFLVLKEWQEQLKNYEWKWKIKALFLIVIIVFLFIDQLIKLLIQKYCAYEQFYQFIPGFISINYTLNHGSAFGLNQGKFTMLITIGIIVSFLGLIWCLLAKSTIRTLGLSFIIAGTLGNVIDRFLYDKGVVDFLQWDLFAPQTIFNCADVYITIGIITIIIDIIFDTISTMRQEKQEKLGVIVHE